MAPSFPAPMTEDIRKAVQSGKLTSAAGTALAKLPPGTFVQHKSWGYGVVVAHDFLLSQTTIDFKAKKGHSMQLQYAGESLTALPSDHIAAKKFQNLDAVRKLGQSDPAALVRLCSRASPDARRRIKSQRNSCRMFSAMQPLRNGGRPRSAR